MIDHLHIKNFLAFPELEVPELKLINLVAGKNNAGKTALLEALQMLKSPHKALVLDQIIQRRSSNKSALSVLHQNGKLLSSLSCQINELNIEVGSEAYDSRFLDKNGQTIGRPEPEDLVTTQYAAITSKTNDHNWIVLAWNSLVLTPNEDIIVSILGNITGIDIARIAVTDTSVKIKIHKNDRPVDIKSLGDGMMRILQIVTA
ncbi:MAG: AAA family ATPase, partial [Lewinella sp.]|nr:AAA family ATPase [Lewinella sp.]